MSLWSEFYSGESGHIVRLIHEEQFNALDQDASVRNLSFSGGIGRPFLFPDDFNLLIEECDRKQGTDFGNFSGMFAAQVWGETDDTTAECQAFSLTPEAVSALASLSDEAILNTADRLKAKMAQSRAAYHAWEKGHRWEERLKKELALHALPIGLSIGVQGSDFPTLAKILVPIGTFGPLWGFGYGSGIFALDAARKDPLLRAEERNMTGRRA